MLDTQEPWPDFEICPGGRVTLARPYHVFEMADLWCRENLVGAWDCRRRFTTANKAPIYQFAFGDAEDMLRFKLTWL